MPKSEGRKKAEAVVTYPLDWIEERTGWVGAVKYFLFRKVPRSTNWFHTLGSATLTAFLVQTITGIILAMYYKPDPDAAYESILFITNDLTWGWLVRGCTASARASSSSSCSSTWRGCSCSAPTSTRVR